MPPVGELADASMKINGYACRLFLGAWFDSPVAPCSGGPEFGWPSVRVAVSSGGRQLPPRGDRWRALLQVRSPCDRHSAGSQT
jgi:hypothetical protein